MSWKGLLVAIFLTIPVIGHTQPKAERIAGEYMESRTADVYTGPCIANSEVGLTGQEAIMAWHVEGGAFNGVPLDGLSVVAVVRANSTLGDPYANPLPARAEFLVDQNADQEQRAELVRFAQAQSGGLLGDVTSVSAVPIRFEMAMAQASATLEAGNVVRLTTRAVTMDDMICHNEDVFYPPLAGNLTHDMPAVSAESTYRGSDLGITWSETGRRSSFVGMFAEGGAPSRNLEGQ